MQQNWIERIDTNTSLFNSHFGSIEKETLNWKPNPGTWSIGQNIEHLIQINETYFKVFSELESGSIKLPFYRKIEFISSFFGRLILNAVEPDRKKKGKTFSIWDPSESAVPLNIFEKFSGSQQKLKEYILRLEPHIKNKATIYTPVSKYIVLPLNTGIEIVVTHQERHFNQAIELFREINQK